MHVIASFSAPAFLHILYTNNENSKLMEVTPYVGCRFLIMHSVFSSSTSSTGFHLGSVAGCSLVLESFPAKTRTDAQSHL